MFHVKQFYVKRLEINNLTYNRDFPITNRVFPIFCIVNIHYLCNIKINDMSNFKHLRMYNLYVLRVIRVPDNTEVLVRYYERLIDAQLAQRFYERHYSVIGSYNVFIDM